MGLHSDPDTDRSSTNRSIDTHVESADVWGLQLPQDEALGFVLAIELKSPRLLGVTNHACMM